MLQAAAGRAWLKTRPPRRGKHSACSTQGNRSSPGGSMSKPEDDEDSLRASQSQTESSQSPLPQVSTQSSASQMRDAPVEHFNSGDTWAAFRPLFSLDAKSRKAKLKRLTSYVQPEKKPSIPPAKPVVLSASGRRRNIMLTQDITPHERAILARSADEAVLQGIPVACTSDIDSLPVHDDASYCSGLEFFPCSDTDPPWDDVACTFSAVDLSDITVHYDPCPVGPKWLSRPRTSAELRANLLQLAGCVTTISVRRLASYHDAYPRLRDVHTFNVLVDVAIRYAKFSYAEYFLDCMRQGGLKPDTRTLQLWVRLDIRVGRWSEAWTREVERCSIENRGMDLQVWLEFHTTAKERAFYRQEKEDTNTLLRRLHLLSQHPPAVTPEQYQKMPPYVILYVVRALIRARARSAAVSLTKHSLRDLPPKLDDKQKKLYLDLIHLHLAPGWVRGLEEYYRLKKLVFDLLKLHRDLRPTSTTLFSLLRPLQKKRRCNELAESLVSTFVSQWGPNVVDDRVRRRLLAFALKHDKLPKAVEHARRQSIVEDARRDELAAEATAHVEQDPGVLDARRSVDALQYSHKDREKHHWRVALERLLKKLDVQGRTHVVNEVQHVDAAEAGQHAAPDFTGRDNAMFLPEIGETVASRFDGYTYSSDWDHELSVEKNTS
ncbi:hypothetical protein CERSUDRAFT_90567 [Gelatoporia subvermispora B]|uniref:Uncharacterized protein n=1 Tax=Ceriporiopsis subvermispora (strain B) TaxID=914234 RepID=M2RU55_CERS8|nr:hypothetical protein CERSUDRAFT_90567 [Gelatoporia subvermispora B]